MNVSWLTFDDSGTTVDPVSLYSPIASVRCRLLIPLRPLEALGHRVQILNVQAGDAPEAVASRLSGEVVIISKVMIPGEGPFNRMSACVSRLMAAARRDGRRIMVDVCDDLFGVPEYGDFMKQLVASADMVVTASAALRDVVQRHSSRPTRIAEDPCESAWGEPRYAPPAARPTSLFGRLIGSLAPARRRPLKLLWHGHGSNFGAVVDFIPELERLTDRYSLQFNLVTSKESGAPQLCAHFNERHASLCELRFTPWTMEALQAGFEECDFVVIPTRLSDPTKLVKSSNRLVQSLWAGRFVIAHPVLAYQALEAYAWVGDDLVEGIEWALRNPRDALHRLEAGQEYVKTHYSPTIIARQWEAAIGEAAAMGSAPA